jgi:branched-chain amino acid transport system permease protein
MFYREAGQYKTSYQADQALFPIRQDQIGIGLILAGAFVLVPLFASGFVIDSILTPILIFSLAAIGLNLLTGYTGLLSLGTGGFMGVGAFTCYKLSTYFPDINIIILVVCSGFLAAAAGLLFGLPSLRIKGFYLAVATLASQFFLSWCFIRIPWLYNYNVSASIEVPARTLFGIPVTGPNATPITRYIIVLTIVAVMTLLASNLLRGRIGRTWMAVRDMDIAAELIGIKLYPTKLLAFAVSSFYCGVAGAMLVFLWLGNAESESFSINQSFLVLFMVIIGAALDLPMTSATLEHINFMTLGILIILFLIAEPSGLARLWQIGKQKLRVWPFPY